MDQLRDRGFELHCSWTEFLAYMVKKQYELNWEVRWTGNHRFPLIVIACQWCDVWTAWGRSEFWSPKIAWHYDSQLWTREFGNYVTNHCFLSTVAFTWTPGWSGVSKDVNNKYLRNSISWGIKLMTLGIIIRSQINGIINEMKIWWRDDQWKHTICD